MSQTLEVIISLQKGKIEHMCDMIEDLRRENEALKKEVKRLRGHNGSEPKLHKGGK